MADNSVESLSGLPKAELHLHIEGTLEPDMMIELGRRNRVPLPFEDVDAARAAYVFSDLQSFLDVYYAGCAVLCSAQDFYDLTSAYIKRARSQGVRHAEIFFDPQTHTQRGVRFAEVLEGIDAALRDFEKDDGPSYRLIMCFLRHLSQEDAMATLAEAAPYLDRITAVGLDSSEASHPPSKFVEVFERARSSGLLAVAHAGEEGPPQYIQEALDLLHVRRIDHGVRCLEDPLLVARLAHEEVPLTVCPLSNVRLGVVPRLEAHPLPALLRAGLRVTVNSDDPAYFGGYVADNFQAAAAALELTLEEAAQLARNSFLASFLPEAERLERAREVDRWLARTKSAPGEVAGEQAPDP